jgi:cyclin-dependent kinase regulatory subunit CKS1
VILPKQIAKKLPARLLTETEWRALGVQQSPGWEHYERHDPEPHILLFRRALDHPYATKPPQKGTVAH